MKKKGYSAEQIIGKLREAEVLLSQGSTVGEVSRKLGVTEQTYYRWRREYGGMRLDQARRLKELEKENGRLERLVARIIALATRYGRYGYRRITALLRVEGWRVNHKRVERIWRQEGLKVPQKQPKRGRLWLNDGSCIRLRPQRKNHVWSYDLMAARIQDGRAFRMLTILDEYTRECLSITVARRITAQEVIYQLGELFLERGIPEHIRSDNGPEFTARAIRQWLRDLGIKTLYIEPGSPWENGYIESFNGKLRDELCNVEIFTTLFEAKVLIENWRKDYNQIRPHSALGYRPPEPEAILSDYGLTTLTLSVVQ